MVPTKTTQPFRLLLLGIFLVKCFSFSLLATPLSPPIVNTNNGHTYILLNNTNWTASEAEAVTLGGHLATIRNQKEQDWVFNTFSHYGGQNRLLWIGLNDAAGEGRFSWISGEPWFYANWNVDEPNNGASGESYVAMYDPSIAEASKWNDWANRVTSPFGKPLNGVVEIIPAITDPPNFDPYIFTTIAGLPGSNGWSDGTNSNARLSGVGLAVGLDDNLYAADEFNNCIRKISHVGTNWVTTTIAGTTNFGFANGTGTNAGFEAPWDIAVDSNTNIYVAGRVDQTIRKITIQGNVGTVTTLAGTPDVYGFADGTNSAAKFHNPNGVGVDKLGNVFVGDSVNNRIRMITTNGVVSTIAGSTQGYLDGYGTNALFYYPHDLKVDKAGNIYVCDTYNHLIRKIRWFGTNIWNVSTIAGKYQTDGSGVPQGGYADGNGTNAVFNRPYNLALDDYGNIFVSDCYSNRCIRKICRIGTNWVVTTVAGFPATRGTADGTGGNARFNGSYDGIAVDSKGNVFVHDQAAIRIGTPTPQISRYGNQAMVFWQASGFQLQASSTLSGAGIWSPMTNFTLMNSMFYVTNAITGDKRFFRLR